MTADASLARRRWVVLVTLLVGAVSLGFTLRLEPGDWRFVAGAAWMAAVWVVGALVSGPLPDRGRGPRALGTGVLVGLAAVATTVVGGLVVAHFPVLREPAEELLQHAGPDTVLVVVLTLVNGVSEELFFRGALYDAIPARLAVPVTTVVYALSTVGAGVLLLVVAATLLGAMTALLRQRTGGLLAPVATHVIWSVGMLLLLPSVLATGG